MRRPSLKLHLSTISPCNTAVILYAKLLILATKVRQKPGKKIWFNPSFSKNVETNIGRKFLRLVDKHFPKHHHLHKIRNRQFNISYSCMPNMHAIISAHNKRQAKSKVHPVPQHHATVAIGAYVRWMATVGKRL